MVSGDGQVDATTLEAGTAQGGTPDTVGEPTKGAAPTEPSASTPPIDWDSDDNPWKATAKKSDERAKSALGQLRRQSEQEALMLSTREELSAIKEYLTDDKIDSTTLKTKLAAIVTKGNEVLLASKNKVVAQTWKNTIIKELTEARIAPDDKRVEPAIDLWTEGGGEENPTDLGKLSEAVMLVKDLAASTKLEASQKETAAEKKARKEDEARFKLDGGFLNNANPRGTPAGGLNDASYTEILRSGKPMPPAEEIDRLTQKYVAGR